MTIRKFLFLLCLSLMGSVVKDKQVRHVVILGGPGTGKTTLVKSLYKKLGELGFRVYVIRDWARHVIAEEKASGGTLLPWIDRVRFERTVVRMHINEYRILYVGGLGRKYDLVIEDCSPFIAPAYIEADSEPQDEWIMKQLKNWAWVVDLAILTSPFNDYRKDDVRWEEREYAIRIHGAVERYAKSIFRDRLVELRSSSIGGRINEVMRILRELGMWRHIKS
jgi:predicted ATPase